MHTNGTASEPFATIGDAIKRPRSWGTALELCRKAAGWSQKQLIAEALKGENVSVADVKRWELARDWPTLNQCNKLRAAMPDLRNFEDLIRLELKEMRKGAPVLKAAVAPEGWPGPPIKHFGEALRWARNNHGLSQGELSRIVGVVTMSPWERDGAVLIRGTYEKLLEVLPELRFAPLPKFSSRYQNQMRAKGYLASQELHRDMARSQQAVAAEEPVMPKVQSVPPRAPDPAPINAAGANYGILVATVLGLEHDKADMEKRHMDEMLVMEERIKRAKAAVEEADAHMRSTARAMRLGTP